MASFKLYDKVWLFDTEHGRIRIYTGSIIEMPDDFNVKGWVRRCEVSTKRGTVSASAGDLVHYGDADEMVNTFNRFSADLQSKLCKMLDRERTNMEKLIDESREVE